MLCPKRLGKVRTFRPVNSAPIEMTLDGCTDNSRDAVLAVRADVRQFFVDSYLLHGPWSASGWTVPDRQAWGAMTTAAAACLFSPLAGLWLGLIALTVAIVSLLFLCFVVPNFSLKVERVIYSNLAKLVPGWGSVIGAVLMRPPRCARRRRGPGR